MVFSLGSFGEESILGMLRMNECGVIAVLLKILCGRLIGITSPPIKLNPCFESLCFLSFEPFLRNPKQKISLNLYGKNLKMKE